MADPRDALRLLPPYRRCRDSFDTEEGTHGSTADIRGASARLSSSDRAVRHHRDRRRPGRPRDGLPPEEAGTAVRHPRCERAHRRLVAHAHVALASPFTPARFDGLPGWSFPAPRWSFPTAKEDRRLPRGVCGALRAPRPQRHRRRPAAQGRRPVRRRRGRAALRSRPRRRRDRLSTASRGFPTSPRSSIPRIVQMHSQRVPRAVTVARGRRSRSSAPATREPTSRWR